MFALGYGVGAIPFMLAIARDAKDAPNAADTVSMANAAMLQIYEAYWQAFKSMPDAMPFRSRRAAVSSSETSIDVEENGRPT
jgi:hypothetical protein